DGDDGGDGDGGSGGDGGGDGGCHVEMVYMEREMVSWSWGRTGDEMDD
ncbi:hypothetical protein Tco_1074294, partial [Tanacetum coccineum]